MHVDEMKAHEKAIDEITEVAEGFDSMREYINLTNLQFNELGKLLLH